jgi:hypothetical protein
VPQTSTATAKNLYQQWGGEFAKRPGVPSMSGGPVAEEWPQLTAEPALSGACDRVCVELGGAWTSSKSRRAASGFGRSCSSS